MCEFEVNVGPIKATPRNALTAITIHFLPAKLKIFGSIVSEILIGCPRHVCFHVPLCCCLLTGHREIHRSFQIDTNWLRLARLVLWLLLIAHYLACAFFALGHFSTAKSWIQARGGGR